MTARCYSILVCCAVIHIQSPFVIFCFVLIKCMIDGKPGDLCSLREVCRIFKIGFVEDVGLAVCIYGCQSLCCNVGDDDAFRRFSLTEEVNVFNLFCFEEAKHR